jgi:hypothetical protein
MSPFKLTLNDDTLYLFLVDIVVLPLSNCGEREYDNDTGRDTRILLSICPRVIDSISGSGAQGENQLRCGAAKVDCRIVSFCLVWKSIE